MSPYIAFVCLLFNTKIFTFLIPCWDLLFLNTSFPFSIAGFPECGADTLYNQLANHPLLHAVKPPSSDFSAIPNGVNKDMFTDSHFWDNSQCIQDLTMDQFTRRYPFDAIGKSFKKYGLQSMNATHASDDLRDIIFIDYVPRICYHGDSWPEEEENWKTFMPYYLLPFRLHYVTPSARIVFLVCDPVSRTYRDYLRYSSITSASYFHTKVNKAITWWDQCTKLGLTRQPCIYGPAPLTLDFHNSPSCGMLTFAPHICREGHFTYWGCGNAIDRLRISMYHVYIQNWVNAFRDTKQLLVMKSEDFDADFLSSIQQIFTFLKVEKDMFDLEYSLPIRLIQQNTHQDLLGTYKETEIALQEFFTHSNAKLTRLLERKNDLWTYG